jgi:hypothetical protein
MPLHALTWQVSVGMPCWPIVPFQRNRVDASTNHKCTMSFLSPAWPLRSIIIIILETNQLVRSRRPRGTGHDRHPFVLAWRHRLMSDQGPRRFEMNVMSFIFHRHSRSYLEYQRFYELNEKDGYCNIRRQQHDRLVSNTDEDDEHDVSSRPFTNLNKCGRQAKRILDWT